MKADDDPLFDLKSHQKLADFINVLFTKITRHPNNKNVIGLSISISDLHDELSKMFKHDFNGVASPYSEKDLLQKAWNESIEAASISEQHLDVELYPEETKDGNTKPNTTAK